MRDLGRFPDLDFAVSQVASVVGHAGDRVFSRLGETREMIGVTVALDGAAAARAAEGPLPETSERGTLAELLPVAADLLRRDNLTRRCCLFLGRGGEETECLTYVQALYRRGELTVLVYARSVDVAFKLREDLRVLSAWAQALALLLADGARVRELGFCMGSAHVYVGEDGTLRDPRTGS